MNLLFDFYGSMLTQKQANCFTMRYAQDYSLAEIAEELDISPQAVVDFLNRATSSLKRYESHLELVRKFQERKILADRILSALNGLEQEVLHSKPAVELIKTTVGELIHI